MKNIHTLSTDKPSRLKQNKITKKISLVNKGIDLTSNIPINIFITSDEEIKEGDWYLEEKSNFNPKKLISEEWGDGQHFKTFNQKGFRKIILTTDQDLIKDGVQAIEDEFFEWFVQNPSYEFVETKVVFIQTPDNLKDGFYYKLNY